MISTNGIIVIAVVGVPESEDTIIPSTAEPKVRRNIVTKFSINAGRKTPSDGACLKKPKIRHMINISTV